MSDHTKPNPWDRRMWGVAIHFHDDSSPRLIGSLWDQELCDRYHYAGEPTRPLLFKTRAQARAWCRRNMDGWGPGRPTWALRPVRVRETISIEHVRPAGRRR